MAIGATQQIVMNNARNLVLKYTFSGTTGDVTVLKIVDVSALDADITSVSIMKVHAAISGFSATLIWDATSNVDAIGIPSVVPVAYDFSRYGGLKNNAGSGVTGDILLSTDGYTAAAGEDNSHIILELHKKF